MLSQNPRQPKPIRSRVPIAILRLFLILIHVAILRFDVCQQHPHPMVLLLLGYKDKFGVAAQ